MLSGLNFSESPLGHMEGTSVISMTQINPSKAAKLRARAVRKHLHLDHRPRPRPPASIAPMTASTTRLARGRRACVRACVSYACLQFLTG